MGNKGKNESSRAYWQGYRDARIAALMYILEHRASIFENAFFDNDLLYNSGFDAGLASFENELDRAIAYDTRLTRLYKG